MDIKNDENQTFSEAETQRNPDPMGVTPTASSLLPPTIGSSTPISEITRDDLTIPIVGSYDSVLIPSYRLPPFNPDLFLSQEGWAELENMLTMSHIRSAIMAKISMVLQDDWVLQPTNNDQGKKYADYMEYVLRNIEDKAGNIQDFRSWLWELGLATHYGFSLSEIIYKYIKGGQYSGYIGLSRLAHKPAKMIGFDLDAHTMSVRNITAFTPLTGYKFNIPVEKCIIYTYNPSNNLPYGNGDGRSNYPHFFSLSMIIKAWNVALDKYGSPYMVVKGKDQILQQMAAAVDQMRQSGTLALPMGVEGELQSPVAGSFEWFQVAYETHRKAILENCLGSSLGVSDGGGRGSYALGKVHADTTESIISFVRKDMEGVINTQLIRRLMILNFGKDSLQYAPSISLGGDSREYTPEDYAKLVDAAILDPRDELIRENLGFPPLSELNEEKMSQDQLESFLELRKK
jgi:hypothetical protein